MLIHASHILQTSEKKAKRLKARLDAGELRFEEGVERYSDCPSKAHQGDLGWFAPGVLPQKFEKALWQAPLNQVSEPAESEYGWHLFFVHAKSAAHG
ncbi:peptidylprolyl isomerase [Thiomicrospira microaerophila]|jgi:parvulin-like peptidyl-prolyl isomerase|uniref:peptidylprolyl isomerase n=1 Tax=Thiomicrospira microaerophila TaxID=406020 RepID=UPI0005C8FF19|nr:peptidylprolyl isomerase [Thiomicrospira microaerophila]